MERSPEEQARASVAVDVEKVRILARSAGGARLARRGGYQVVEVNAGGCRHCMSGRTGTAVRYCGAPAPLLTTRRRGSRSYRANTDCAAAYVGH